jgi:hypothetical protein
MAINPARRIVVASFCFCTSLVFLWVPWTSDAGYSWLWSKPQLRAIQYDLVADARQRWNAEYRANDEATVGEKWVRAIQEAGPEDKDRVKEEAKRALGMANLKRVSLSDRRSMSDEEVLNWLDQRDNFESTFPEKANLDESGRKKMIGEWKQVVLPAKEWNERIRYTSVDYHRIGMELAALTGLFALALVLTPRRT